MDASIVIVSYNGQELLRRCLASIYQHTQGLSFEVIVVDNSSRDGTPEMVEQEFSQVRLVRRSSNAGFAAAVNEGISQAAGDTFVVLNPDTELDTNVLAPALAYLRGHPEIGILAPKLLDDDGALQLSCRAFPGFATALFNRYSLLTRLLPKNRFSSRYLMSGFDHSRTADVDWASAACWLIQRSAYERTGPMDEAYFWSIEDVDYCQRVHRAGLRVVYFPEVSLQHHIGGSSRTAPARTTIARHRGMWRYYRAYLRPAAPVVTQLVDVAVLTGITVRLGAQLVVSSVKRAVTRQGG